jgi:hypothetical protein
LIGQCTQFRRIAIVGDHHFEWLIDTGLELVPGNRGNGLSTGIEQPPYEARACD